MMIFLFKKAFAIKINRACKILGNVAIATVCCSRPYDQGQFLFYVIRLPPICEASDYGQTLLAEYKTLRGYAEQSKK